MVTYFLDAFFVCRCSRCSMSLLLFTLVITLSTHYSRCLLILKSTEVHLKLSDAKEWLHLLGKRTKVSGSHEHILFIYQSQPLTK